MRNCALINARQPGVAGNRNVPHTEQYVMIAIAAFIAVGI